MLKKTTAVIILIGLILSTAGCEKEKSVAEEAKNVKPKTVSEETASSVESVVLSEPEKTTEIVEQEQTKPSESEVISTESVETEFVKEKQIIVTEPTISETEIIVTEEKNIEENEKRELSFLDKEKNEGIEIAPIIPHVISATAEDSEIIAEKILEYINSNKNVSAVKLDGLTKYAEYRSRQLIGRFAHNTEDERAAATALEYGEYVEPSLYGMTGEPYYTSCSREAIAKAGYAGTADEIAIRFANLIKNSAKHWCYVGADEYSYIGVGVTYESGMWYCDVAVAKENTDEK